MRLSQFAKKVSVMVAATVLMAAGLGGTVMAHPEGLVTKKSNNSVAETIDKFAAVAESKGLKIFARIDHAKGAEGAGLELRPTTLLIFGNPQGGTPLMQSAQTMGIDLPLKALAYEDADGTVYLTYNDPAYLAERHNVKDKDPVVEKISGALNAFSSAATQ